MMIPMFVAVAAAAANMTVADSLLHSALTVNVSQHAVEAQRLVLNGDMEARSVTVQSGDLRVDNGVFVTSEGVSLNISSDFSVGGSVTMLPPDPATPRHTRRWMSGSSASPRATPV